MRGEDASCCMRGDGNKSGYKLTLLAKKEKKKGVFVTHRGYRRAGSREKNGEQACVASPASHESKLSTGHLFAASANLFPSPGGYSVWNMC